MRALAERTSFRIEGPSWLLRRDEGGWVLESAADARELARTMPLVGAGSTSETKYLLLEDGRLFRIALEGPREPGYVLTGWETPGAYFVARPEPNGWRLEPQPSSWGLADLDVRPS